MNIGRWMNISSGMVDAFERQVRSQCGSKEISFPYSPRGMPTLRNLLGGHERALRGLRDLVWLLDVDITSYDFELRLQHIQIQMVALVILHAQLRQLGYITAYDDNVSLTQRHEILERKGLLSEQQTAWLRYFTRQANMAKHDLSRL